MSRKAWNFKNLIGERFCRLVVIKRAENDSRGSARWVCRCDCGGTTIAYTTSLKKGATTSCGCIRYERLLESKQKHSKSNTKIFRIWANMLNRCNRKKDKRYYRYGGRGISVCKRWLEFKNFYADMGDPPEGMTLDRIDNNGDYTPLNCRWATQKQNQRNRGNNHIIKINGIEKCLSEWAEIYNINSSIVLNRIAILGWTPEKALTQKT